MTADQGLSSTALMPRLRRRVSQPSRPPTAVPGDVAAAAVGRLRLVAVLAPTAVALFYLGYNLIVLTQRGRWISEPLDVVGLGLLCAVSALTWVA